MVKSLLGGEGRRGSYILHDANGLLSLSDELVLGLLNLLLGLVAQLRLLVGLGARRSASKLPGVALDTRLDGIEGQAGLLNVLASAGRKHQVGVEGGVPAGQETALDLRILGQAGLAHALHGQGILLEGSSEGILAGTGVLLVEALAAGKTGAGDGVRERLGLRLRAGRCGKGSLGLGGGAGRGQQGDLLADGAAEILEGFLDVGGVVVRLGGIVRAASLCVGLGPSTRKGEEKGLKKSHRTQNLRHSEHLLVHRLERIDSLLEVDVIRRKLGLQDRKLRLALRH